MSQSVKDKLLAQAGESIAEVLVALLISVLGVALLVGMIGASTRVITQSTKTMQDEYRKTSTTSDDASTSVALLDENRSAIVNNSTAVTFPVVYQKYSSEIIYYTPK